MHPLVKQYKQQFQAYFPEGPYPVITTGVILFMVLVWVGTVFNPELIQTWSLSANSIIDDFETYRFNTYPLVHISLIHLLCNVMMLYHPLAEFEKTHGSLHTALMLNTLGAITAIAYTITCFITTYLGISSREIMDISILGSSAWVFTFITVHYCYKSLVNSMTLIHNVNVPTLYIPLIYLLLTMIIVPNSSFLGHLIGMILGVLIFKGILAHLTIPPFQILDKIENLTLFKSAIEILFPNDIFVWTREENVKHSRYAKCSFESVDLTFSSVSLDNTTTLPLHHKETTVSEPPAFVGQGEKLGTNL